MTDIPIGLVLGWKSPGLQGVSTFAGVITAYPGGIPSQQDQDLWTTEYELWKAQTDKIADINDLRDIKKSLPLVSEGLTIDSGDLQVGEMATTLFLGRGASIDVTLLTVSGTTASASTQKKHNLVTGQTVTVIDADQPEYNVTAVITVTGNKTFDYTIAGTPASPATGTPKFTKGTFRHIPTTNETNVFVDELAYGQIANDLKGYVDDCQFRARELKNLVEGATTVVEIDAIDITVGWPDTGV